MEERACVSGVHDWTAHVARDMCSAAIGGGPFSLISRQN